MVNSTIEMLRGIGRTQGLVPEAGRKQQVPYEGFLEAFPQQSTCDPRKDVGVAVLLDL